MFLPFPFVAFVFFVVKGFLFLRRRKNGKATRR